MFSKVAVLLAITASSTLAAPGVSLSPSLGVLLIVAYTNAARDSKWPSP
jgi:hypothetical protein